MDIEQVREIERACTDVLLQNGRLTDHEEWEKAVALFTPDVVFKGIASGVTAVGREENVASMKSRIQDQWRRRIISNVMVTVQDADHATVTAYWTMYKHKKSDVLDGNIPDATPTHFCETEDQFVRMDEGWRIARREFNEII
jgi:3-phenylpropionate/cinnamic acid dioxygenase small subunit